MAVDGEQLSADVSPCRRSPAQESDERPRVKTASLDTRNTSLKKHEDTCGICVKAREDACDKYVRAREDTCGIYVRARGDTCGICVGASDSLMEGGRQRAGGRRDRKKGLGRRGAECLGGP